MGRRGPGGAADQEDVGRRRRAEGVHQGLPGEGVHGVDGKVPDVSGERVEKRQYVKTIYINIYLYMYIKMYGITSDLWFSSVDHM